MTRKKAKFVTRTAPELLYHGTGVEIEGAVRPFTHFGTFAAALQRACRTVYARTHHHDGTSWTADMSAPVLIYPARVRIASGLVTGDLQGVIKNHSPNLLAEHLHYDSGKAISSDEFGQVVSAVSRGQDGYAVLREILRGKGYDGLAYTNEFEDKDSLSWIAVDGEQAVLGEPIRMTLGEALRLHEEGVTEPPTRTEPEAVAPAP